MSVALARLRRSLDELERPATFWWRDDDAGPADPALSGLLALAEGEGWPVSLAVVPAQLEPVTVERIERSGAAHVWQHGWSHANHAAPGERKVELGGAWPVPAMADALDRGKAVLEVAFGDRFTPVLVPPWNRMCASAAALVHGRYRAVSALRPADPRPMPGRLDVDLDVMSWRHGADFLGLDTLVERLVRHLEREPRGPVGILTHHRVTDEPAMRDIAVLLRFLSAHPGVEIRAGKDLAERA